jgi:hypothetical protein
MKKLLYRIVPHNNGLVFAPPEEAEYIAKIHSSISTSGTWKEFKSSMPAEEYQQIIDEIHELYGDDEPEPDAPFSGDMIPGWVDGDYPAWLQQDMGQFLPPKILERYATKKITAVNGYYWDIAPESINSIINDLEKEGITAICSQDLLFH